MKRILIMTDHPNLDTGFSCVGKHIAGHLHNTERWDVHYLGWYKSMVRHTKFPYKTYHTKLDGVTPRESDKYGRESFDEIVEHLIKPLRKKKEKLLVLCIGDVWMQDHTIFSKYRDYIHICSYVPIDGSPIPLKWANFFELVDTIVPYTEFGKKVISQCCDIALPFKFNKKMVPIPHGVDSKIFTAFPDDLKKQLKRGFFHMEPENMIIGFFSRNQARKRLDIVLKVFKIYSEGLYVRCNICKQVTSYTINPIDCTYDSVERCRHCNSSKIERGKERPEDRLYLHCDLMEDVGSLLRTGGWDIRSLATRWNIMKKVILNDKLAVGHGVPINKLVEIINACDMHYLPTVGGGWELTVLETGACGIPNIVTDVSAPPEFAKDFSILVPVGHYDTEGRSGIERGIVDVEKSVDALVTLANNPQLRDKLGKRGIEVAKEYDWKRVAARWEDFLNSLSLDYRDKKPEDPVYMRVV